MSASRAATALTWERALIVLLLVVVAALSFGVSGFFDGIGSFLALTENFLPFGLVALGLTTVILTGGIDLSVGAVAGLAAVVMAELWFALHLSIWLAAIAGIAVGGLAGALNGLIITRLRVEPLIATLATSFIFSSSATAIAGPSPPSGFPDAFNAVGAGTLIGPVPVQLVLFAAFALLFVAVLHGTGFGRRIIMIGHNEAAARYSGVRVERVLLATYIVSGLMAAVTGIVLAAYYSAVRADMGDLLLLSTITTVVLGGVSIFGGEGHVGGVVIAVLLLGFLRQGMLIAGLSDMVTTMVTGALLLGAIALRNLLAGRGLAPFLARLRLRTNPT